MDIDCLTILEAGRLQSRCQQVCFLLTAMRAGCVPGLSAWHVDIRLLPVSLHGPPSVRVCILISSTYKNTRHVGHTHILRYLCLELQHMDLGATNQPITPSVRLTVNHVKSETRTYSTSYSWHIAQGLACGRS